ncbi:hypothetical protein [Bacillus sp. CDB3]|uniref:hypothetical protein n=1 Tax=Bacillus sp. CDB3 TaxID=360310 RepID=UPI0009D854D4|nr:hypothetical protein [Bacillus sp. CDB3]OQR53130.1 hypothetical protein CDB3_31915 [Bacillus sp. CDB3]
MKQAGLYGLFEGFQKKIKDFKQTVERYFQKRPQRTVHVLKEMVAKVYPRFSGWNPKLLEEKENQMAVVDEKNNMLYFRKGHTLEQVKEYCVDALLNKKALQEGHQVDIFHYGETFGQIWRETQYQEQQFRKKIDQEFDRDPEKVVHRLEDMVKKIDPTVTKIQYAFAGQTDKPSPLYQKGQVLIKTIGYQQERYKEACLSRLVETPIKELQRVWEQQKQVEQVKTQTITKEQENELSR